MKIGMMADLYKPHVSGVTNYISLNKSCLESLGHEVFVITFGSVDYQDDEPNVIRSPGVPILDTGYYLGLGYSTQARKIVRSLDVAHIHHPFVTGTLAMRHCRPYGIPVIFTNHTRYDLYAQAYMPAVPDVIGETALQAYMPGFCRACDLVIAPSEGMRDVLVGFGVDTFIDVVPNGVDLKPFQIPKGHICREDLGFTSDDVIMVYTGRLGPEKNVSFLLRAFNGVAQVNPQIRLLLVGDGPEREAMQERVNELDLGNRVRFTGMVPYSELPDYVALADGFMTASVTEVHPLSVIEAMAAGLPVLGIQSPGVGDIVQNEKTGFLVEGEDLAVFTAKLFRLVTDGAKRKEMGEQARLVAQAYSIDRTTQLMIERYQRVVDASAGRKRTFLTNFLRAVGGVKQPK